MSANVNSRMTIDSFVAHVVAANRQQDAIAAGHLTQQTLNSWVQSHGNQANQGN